MLRAIFCLFLWSTTLWATTVYKPSLDEMLPTKWEILHVRIEEGKAHNFEFEGRQDVCGMSYKASVIERIWGSADFGTLTFDSWAALTVSHEYIIFVGEPVTVLPPGYKVASKPHNYPFVDSDSFQMCIKNLQGVLEGGTTFEFMPGLRDQEGNLEWLIKELTSPHIPESVKTMKTRCESEDNDETACDVISESVFIHWPSLRAFLLEKQKTQ